MGGIATVCSVGWFLSMLRIPLMDKWFSLLNHHSQNGGIPTFQNQIKTFLNFRVKRHDKEQNAISKS